MKIIKQTRLILFVLIAVYLAGCTLPRSSIKNLSEVKPHEVIFVGKMQLIPHIKKNEVIYKNMINLSDIEPYQVLYMKASDKFYDLKGNQSLDMSDSIAVLDGKYFYFTWPQGKPINILGVSFITRSTGRNLDTMTFTINKGVKVNYPGNAKAVYVGTISFKRDEFFNIKKIDINQKNYTKARNEFRTKYRTRMNLVKAKLSSSR